MMTVMGIYVPSAYKIAAPTKQGNKKFEREATESMAIRHQ
jgi:hypothetical protein